MFFVYSLAYGSPFQKYNFKNEAIQYLKKTYPDEKTKLLDIEYSFKWSNGDHDYFEAHFYFLNDNSHKQYTVYKINMNTELDDNFRDPM